jgi:hypothetical protein
MFEQGIKLSNEGNYAGALAEFQRSYKLTPAAPVLYNIASCEKELARYTEAVAHFTEYLSHSADLPPAQVARAQKALDELQALLGDVVIAITPASLIGQATVMIDSHNVDAASLSHLIKMPSGTHSIEVSADGYKPFKREFTVAAGVAANIPVALEVLPTTAILHITTSAPQATVTIDNVIKGMAPLDVELKGGAHHVEVAATGYNPHDEDVVITPGDNRPINIELQKIQLQQVVIQKIAESGHWYSKASFWIPTAIVVIGGAVGGYFLATEPSPIKGTLNPGLGQLP